MASFVIEGGHKLHGEIHPQGAKNEVLQILCATLLTSEEVTVTNIPDILDVNNLIQLLRDMGVKVSKTGIDSYTFKADTVDLNYLASDDFHSAWISHVGWSVGCPFWKGFDFKTGR